MLSLFEIEVTALLFVWVIFVVAILTRSLYYWMLKRGVENNVAVYFNRKVVHIFAGGICAAVVPFVFETPILPLVFAMFLAILTYVPHKLGKILFWFQTEENMYEVTFAIMWGLIIALGWFLSKGNFWFGILPVLFMAVGDALTGIVRNVIYRRRTKSWWGNLTMALFAIPLGAMLGFAGILAGAVASVIEHFEFYPIDDNATVPSISFLILLLAKFYAPSLLQF